MKSLKTLIVAAALSAAVLPGLGAGTAHAAPVTFDFTTDPFSGNDNGITTLKGDALSPATWAADDGSTMQIVTFLSGGSSLTYALDTFGSGPPRFVDTFLFGQRALFYFGANGGPLVDYRLGSEARILSATFLLYNPSQNLAINFRNGGRTERTEEYFWDTDAYDDLANNPPAVPPELTVLFDNTFPLADQLTMRSLGGTGAALKTLVIDYPAIVAPVPLPASLPLIAAPLLVLGSFAAARRRARRTS